MYMLFAGEASSSLGGMLDLVGIFKTESEAKESLPKYTDWAHIYDLEELSICATYSIVKYSHVWT